ncbi:hypothetical protein BDC45DRAFT_540725 [Circinella umbellata]|nr:hypothetical protein BDC45DRAFT_540725 [Circinella umbellata]
MIITTTLPSDTTFSSSIITCLPSVVVTPPDSDMPSNIISIATTKNNSHNSFNDNNCNDNNNSNSNIINSSTYDYDKMDTITTSLQSEIPIHEEHNDNAIPEANNQNKIHEKKIRSSTFCSPSLPTSPLCFTPANSDINNKTIVDTRKNIPPFFFPHGKPAAPEERDRKIRKIMAIVRHLYSAQPYLSEPHFVAITRTCGLPRYMNIALFRRIDFMHQRDERITLDQFAHGWTELSRDRYDDESLFFNILRKPNCAWLLPEDFLPVLEDIVLHHPGLRFLADNSMFQERYIETVICRLYYEARCPSGKMTLSQFRRSDFANMIHMLGPNVDLNSTRDCFSYKHFYVLYCKFWTLDDDHDLIISEANLAKYNQAALAPRVVHRIMQCGRIAAFARDQSGSGVWGDTPTLTYLDYIWFLLSEVDKSTPMAIEYWFRCMDTDGDGILSSYELAQFWQEQEARQRFYGVADDDQIQFQNILCQMNDLIQPQVPGQFRLHDLKQNGFLAERFFDTFLNFDRFQIHESYQGSIRAKRKQEQDRRRQLQQSDNNNNNLSVVSAIEDELAAFDESLGYFTISDWCDYAETEYQQLLLNERNDIVWDDEEDEDEQEDEEEDEEDDDIGYLAEEEVEDEEEEEEEEEEESSSSLLIEEREVIGNDSDNISLGDMIMSPVSQAEEVKLYSEQHHNNDRHDETEMKPDIVNPGESSSSTSDHDSDTSAPTTPTKDPTAPAPPSWATANPNTNATTGVNPTTESVVQKIQHGDSRQGQQPWLWQPHDEDDNDVEEEEREDRATEWIWWLSRQRLSEPS